MTPEVVDMPEVGPIGGETREDFLRRLFDLASALEVAAQLSRPELWPNRLSPRARIGAKLRVRLPREWGYTAATIAGVIGTAPMRRLDENHTIVRFERVYYVEEPGPWVSQ